MQRAHVYIRTPALSYPVVVGTRLSSELPALLDEAGFPPHVALITSAPPAALHAGSIEQAVQRSGRSVTRILIPDGEAAKSTESYLAALGGLTKVGSPDGTGILALGGGAVSDLAGFVAGTYRRGIPYAIIPTTLLAQVDSSIGGKVAVNLSEGKNLLGLFYHPRLVLSDVTLLSSLPARQLASGMAEVIKYGLIADAGLADDLERDADRILAKDADALASVVSRCVAIKAEVVGEDPYDDVAGSGRRAILNFGHTIGHAIEAACGYENLLHGEAIAIGMLAAVEISHRLGIVPRDITGRVKAALDRYSLPTRIDASMGCSIESIIHHMKFDKKFRDGVHRFVVLERIGSARLDARVGPELIREVLADRGAPRG